MQQPPPQNNSLFAGHSMDGFGGGGAPGSAANTSSISDVYSSQLVCGMGQSSTQDDSDLGSVASSSFMMNTGVSEQEKQDIIKHIDELKYAEKRDNALLELSR